VGGNNQKRGLKRVKLAFRVARRGGKKVIIYFFSPLDK